MPRRACRSSPSPPSEARDLLDELIQRLVGLPPGAVYAVIGILAAVENIFPPVPADTAVALGAFLSTAGAVSAWSVFLITWGANVATATAVYLAGRVAGRSFFEGRIGQRLLRPHHLVRLEGLYRHYGVWGIFLSRFIPGVRAVVPPFAGVAHLDFWRSVPPLALASGIWYGALIYLAATVLIRLEDAAELVGRFSYVALAVALLALAAVGVVAWRRHRPPSPSIPLHPPREGDGRGWKTMEGDEKRSGQ